MTALVSLPDLSRRLSHPLLRFLSAALILFAALGLPASTSRAETAPPWVEWQSALHRDHPLVGRIWAAETADFVAPDEMLTALRASDFVLIGEIHDNADHHRLQAWLISEIAMTRRPAVVMEMISADKEVALSAYVRSEGADAAGLGQALDWETSGWPAWDTYQPIAEAAFAAGLAIKAGNPGRDETRAVGMGGLAALSPAERSALSLDAPLTGDLAAALDREMVDGHCGLLPEAMVAPMAGVQRFRDAVLARSIVAADTGTGAVLIAGNGHVRADRGVPLYLAAQAPGRTVATVMLIEVGPSSEAAADWIVTGPEQMPAADFFWFTPAAERGDPCESLRRRFAQ